MKRILSTLFMVGSAVVSASAQPLPPPPPNMAVPIDVVVGLLLIAGVIFGTRKLMKGRTAAEA